MFVWQALYPVSAGDSSDILYNPWWDLRCCQKLSHAHLCLPPLAQLHSHCIMVHWLLLASDWSVSSITGLWLAGHNILIRRSHQQKTNVFLFSGWRKLDRPMGLHPRSCYYNTKLFANRHTVNFIIISARGNSFRGGQVMVQTANLWTCLEEELDLPLTGSSPDLTYTNMCPMMLEWSHFSDFSVSQRSKSFFFLFFGTFVRFEFVGLLGQGLGLVLDNKVKMVHQDRGRRVLCNVMNETIQELQCDSNGVCPLMVISDISDI